MGFVGAPLVVGTAGARLRWVFTACNGAAGAAGGGGGMLAVPLSSPIASASSTYPCSGENRIRGMRPQFSGLALNLAIAGSTQPAIDGSSRAVKLSTAFLHVRTQRGKGKGTILMICSRHVPLTVKQMLVKHGRV